MSKFFLKRSKKSSTSSNTSSPDKKDLRTSTYTSSTHNRRASLPNIQSSSYSSVPRSRANSAPMENFSSPPKLTQIYEKDYKYYDNISRIIDVGTDEETIYDNLLKNEQYLISKSSYTFENEEATRISSSMLLRKLIINNNDFHISYSIKVGADVNAIYYYDKQDVKSDNISVKALISNQPASLFNLAVFKGKRNVIDELLKANPIPDKDLEVPIYNSLILACENNDINTARELLNRGWPINDSHYNNFLKTTALHTAIENENFELVELLLLRGANPEIVDHKGERPIDIIVKKIAAGAPNVKNENLNKILGLLLDRGVDLYDTGNPENSPRALFMAHQGKLENAQKEKFNLCMKAAKILGKKFPPESRVKGFNIVEKLGEFLEEATNQRCDKTAIQFALNCSVIRVKTTNKRTGEFYSIGSYLADTKDQLALNMAIKHGLYVAFHDPVIKKGKVIRQEPGIRRKLSVEKKSSEKGLEKKSQERVKSWIMDSIESDESVRCKTYLEQLQAIDPTVTSLPRDAFITNASLDIVKKRAALESKEEKEKKYEGAYQSSSSSSSSSTSQSSSSSSSSSSSTSLPISSSTLEEKKNIDLSSFARSPVGITYVPPSTPPVVASSTDSIETSISMPSRASSSSSVSSSASLPDNKVQEIENQEQEIDVEKSLSLEEMFLTLKREENFSSIPRPIVQQPTVQLSAEEIEKQKYLKMSKREYDNKCREWNEYEKLYKLWKEDYKYASGVAGSEPNRPSVNPYKYEQERNAADKSRG